MSVSPLSTTRPEGHSQHRDKLDLINLLLKQALQHHQAGDFAQAAKNYEQILLLDSQHADSLHLLGMVAYQARMANLAIDLIQRAIAVNSKEAPYHSNLGTILQSQGKHHEAEAEYKIALDLNPNLVETIANLGFTLHAQGKFEQAVHCFERAIALKPEIAEFHFHLGNTFQTDGRLKDAVLCYERALALRPDYAEASCNLGSTFTDQDKLDEAIICFEHALIIRPSLAEAHNGLGIALQALNKPEQAKGHYEKALVLRPDYADAHSNYGTILEAQGMLDCTVTEHTQARSLVSYGSEAHNSLHNTLDALGSLDNAIAHYERALVLNPDLIDTRYNLAMAQLRSGDYVSGWRNYEWRWHTKKSPLKNRTFSQPQWQGEPLNGARILLHAEQGLGDTLQFLRYVPMVQAAGGIVVLAIQERLRRIAEEIPGIAELVSLSYPSHLFEWHCPLLSLPLAFSTTLNTIPAQIPYLSIPEQATKKMAAIPWPSEGLRIGLAWNGNKGFQHDNARMRSIPFSLLEPLAEIDGIHLFSLQIDGSVSELSGYPKTITDLSPYVDDMADTAAQIVHLDLVITVDTSIAHMAGALGVPTWVLLPFTSDWRWLQTREDTPWYPTMRLFRQPAPGDWVSVINNVCDALLTTTINAGFYQSK